MRGCVHTPVKRGRLALTVPGARTSGLPGYQVGGRFGGERLGVHVVRPLFQRRHEGIHDVLVIVRGHARVASPLDHVPELPALELLQRPPQGVGHQRLVPEDAVVLVPGAVVIVRSFSEAVEGQ